MKNIYVLESERNIIYAPTRGKAFFASDKASSIIKKAISNIELTNAEKNSAGYKRYIELIQCPERKIANNHTSTIKYSAITLLLTDDCNLSCSYCYSSDSRTQTTITEPKLNAFLEQLFLILPKKINPKFVFMGGGEPLTRFNLLEKTVLRILDLAKKYQKQVSFSLTTNGTLLNNKTVSFFKKHIFNINLSFDILPEIQNAQRPIKNSKSFDIVNKSIDLLVANQLKFYIRSTITSLNVNLQKEMVEFVSKNYPFIKKLHFEPVTSTTTSNIWKEFPISFMEARARGKELKIDVVCSISNSLKTLRKTFCPGEFTISPEGEIVSCHRVASNKNDFFQNFNYGKIEENKLQLSSQKYIEQKAELKKKYKTDCENCFAEFHCAGYCPQAKLEIINSHFSIEDMCIFIKTLLQMILEQELSIKSNLK